MLGLSSGLEEVSLKINTDLYATIGCHPTRSAEFEKDPSGYFQALDELIGANLSGLGRAVAVGECGLDYDRTHFASTVVQQKHFRGCNHAGHCFTLMERRQALSSPWRRNTTFLCFCIHALRTMILYRSCATRALVKMAGELSVVEVGSSTASQDLLRTQLTMCVLEIRLVKPVSLRDVPRSTWDFTSGSFSGERFLSH